MSRSSSLRCCACLRACARSRDVLSSSMATRRPRSAMRSMTLPPDRYVAFFEATLCLLWARRKRVTQPVMPGLVPGIHVVTLHANKGVDGRDKPGHDVSFWCARSGLRLQLAVPVEIVEPALVPLIRRKPAAVAVQMIDARLERHLRRPHLRFLHRHVAFLEIAGRAGGDHVDPGRVPAARARQQMVEGQVLA